MSTERANAIHIVSEKTTVPVPRILDWSNNSHGQVGTEYIIMDFIDGVRLGEVWDTMNALQRLQCTEKLSRFVTELSKITFNGYGSLNYGQYLEEGLASLSHDGTRCIGPHCGSRYWKCGVDETKLYGEDRGDHGPCEQPVPKHRYPLKLMRANRERLTSVRFRVVPYCSRTSPPAHTTGYAGMER